MNRIVQRFATPVLAMLVWGSWGLADAQEVEVRVQREPHYVGESVIVQVRVVSSNNNGRPEVRLRGSLPDALSVRGPNVSESFSSIVEYSVGSRRRQQKAIFQFTYGVSADKAGDYTIGPFEVLVDGDVLKEVEPIDLHFQDLAVEENMLVEASLDGNTFYVGQRVPLEIKWGFNGAMRDVQFAFDNHLIRSPLFDQFKLLVSEPRTRTRLTLLANQTKASIDAKQTEESVEGDEFIMLTGRCDLMFDSIGEFEFPISCQSRRVTRWREDLFGRVRAAAAAPMMAIGEPLKFKVLPIPEAGRPKSFSGAVGERYTIDVSANRSAVRVGDPLALTIELRGTGLEKMSLPSLKSEGGLDEQKFQIPDDDPAGIFEPGLKQFKVTVRINDESVTEIPPIAFSWFNPTRGEYQTAYSSSIPIDVDPAQIVSADDVVSGAPQRKADNQAANDMDRNVRNAQISAQGLNLAIVEDPEALIKARSLGVLNGKVAEWCIYGSSMLVIGGAFVLKRFRSGRKGKDETLRREKAWIATLTSAARAGDDPESLRRVAEVVRECAKVANGRERDELEVLVAQCEAQIYAPNQRPNGARDLATRALRLVERLRHGSEASQ